MSHYIIYLKLICYITIISQRKHTRQKIGDKSSPPNTHTSTKYLDGLLCKGYSVIDFDNQINHAQKSKSHKYPKFYITKYITQFAN